MPHRAAARPDPHPSPAPARHVHRFGQHPPGTPEAASGTCWHQLWTQLAGSWWGSGHPPRFTADTSAWALDGSSLACPPSTVETALPGTTQWLELLATPGPDTLSSCLPACGLDTTSCLARSGPQAIFCPPWPSWSRWQKEDQNGWEKRKKEEMQKRPSLRCQRGRMSKLEKEMHLKERWGLRIKSTKCNKTEKYYAKCAQRYILSRLIKPNKHCFISNAFLIWETNYRVGRLWKDGKRPPSIIKSRLSLWQSLCHVILFTNLSNSILKWLCFFLSQPWISAMDLLFSCTDICVWPQCRCINYCTYISSPIKVTSAWLASK